MVNKYSTSLANLLLNAAAVTSQRVKLMHPSQTEPRKKIQGIWLKKAIIFLKAPDCDCERRDALSAFAKLAVGGGRDLQRLVSVE